MNQAPVYWAQLTLDPMDTQTKTSTAEKTCLVQRDGQTQTDRIYWKAGGNADYLLKGDWVCLDWDGKYSKWRISKTQTPELMAVLEHRQAVAAPPAPPPQQPPAPTMQQRPPQTHQAQATNGSPIPPQSPDIIEWIKIFEEFRRALPNAKEETCRAAASTVFMSRRKQSE
jgi:hypothetical protein